MSTPQLLRPVVAIHQPNFFPWLGYFDKIRQADCFVLLDQVAYPKSGSGTGSPCNRVKVKIQGQAAWIGCPIQRAHGVQLIQDVKIDDRQPWRKKMLRTLEMNYRKAPSYEQAMAVIEPLVLYETESLLAFNHHAIQALCQPLGISTSFVLQSELQTTHASTDLLIEITRKVGGKTYLSGRGAVVYQEDQRFTEAGLQLCYQDFAPAPYSPEQDFIPGLSVIDFLMWTPLGFGT